MGRPKTNPPAPRAVSYLRKWRQNRGLSQEALAAALDPPRASSTVSRIEDGSSEYRQDVMTELAAALAITPFELIFVDPDNPADVLRQWVATSPYGATAIGDFLSYQAAQVADEMGGAPMPQAGPRRLGKSLHEGSTPYRPGGGGHR